MTKKSKELPISIEIESPVNECVFCGKTKHWNSDITITAKDGTVFTITVCPEDRKRSINELYIEKGSK